MREIVWLCFFALCALLAMACFVGLGVAIVRKSEEKEKKEETLASQGDNDE